MQKTVLVTGATDGIGKETARVFLERGFRVFVHGRSMEKAQRTCDALGGGEAVAGDLSRMAEVRALAEAVGAKTSKLDALVNNAGVFVHERSITDDGFELTMAVNHFAPFVLTHRLLPLLEAASTASAPARAVHVSSVAHQRASLDPTDLEWPNGFQGYAAYARSKLANVLLSSALSRRSRTTHNALHPGVIGTKLLKGGFGMDGASLADGAKTTVKVATADELSTVTGKYFSDEREVAPSKLARDLELSEKLYAVSSERTGEPALPLL
jgi:NAD(P)-dependent dehydrogenase (short-subunit alcohol dehydrogenase family)